MIINPAEIAVDPTTHLVYATKHSVFIFSLICYIHGLRLSHLNHYNDKVNSFDYL